MISIRSFTRTNYKADGTLDWNLEANESYIYPKENKTIVYGFHFTQFENGNYKSRLSGNRGEINHQEKSVLIQGAVELLTNDNKTLTTEELVYNIETKTLVSDAEVIIQTEGTRIKGKGLRADKELNKFTILKPSAVTVGGSNPLKEK